MTDDPARSTGGTDRETGGPPVPQRGKARGALSTTGVTVVGIVVNVALSVAKIGVGVALRSQALLADGFHSASDLVTDSAVLVGLRLSARPPDEDHHYGHGRVTTLMTLIVGVALLATAALIVYNAIRSLRTEPVRSIGMLPFWVALLSVFPKELLFRVTLRVGRQARNTSVVANAWHHRTDVFTSVAAAAGLAGAAFGGPEWAFLDPLTAVVLSAFLVVVAAGFVRGSVGELLDVSPGKATEERIERAIASTPGVREYHTLRLRMMGGAVILDVHIHVDPALSVVEGHDIATEVRGRVLECGCDVRDAIVHIEPCTEGGESSKD